MKKIAFALLALLTYSATAQNMIIERPDSLTTVVRGVSHPKTEWLSPFTKVVVDGPINVTFKRVDTDEGIKIVYDTKGNVNSRFRAGVDKNGVLQIVERIDSKQVVVPTEVTVWYKSLDNISISRATVNFENCVESKILDVYVKAGAIVTMDIKALDADEIIVATGAKAKRLPIKGADTAIEAVDYLLGNKTVGERVVVIGGGLTGCEIAYDLFLQGKKPAVVEMQDDLITTPGICLANTSYLRDCFKTNNVPVHLETRVSEIKADGVVIAHKDGTTETVPADSVILSVGYNPDPVATKGVHVIGDAKNVGNLRTVIWGAWDVCMKL